MQLNLTPTPTPTPVDLVPASFEEELVSTQNDLVLRPQLELVPRFPTMQSLVDALVKFDEDELIGQLRLQFHWVGLMIRCELQRDSIGTNVSLVVPPVTPSIGMAVLRSDPSVGSDTSARSVQGDQISSRASACVASTARIESDITSAPEREDGVVGELSPPQLIRQEAADCVTALQHLPTKTNLTDPEGG